jgi:23S rRNA 5-hydroxycytidine C2501 synthase
LDHLQKRLELLAPARTVDSGIVAINFGADAVYIGAPAFSARAAAGNSVDDIARLSTYAHRFHAKVFVALNTILFDHELDSAQTLIRQLHEAGADALIVQDMGILKMNLPPIELHASTQTNNYSLERIQFLENAGFQRIVLARELTLQQIKEIRTETTVELESFVHGALCVSLSGQCYMSEALGGRSGNRGVCAQPCRKLYDLIDADGRIIMKQKHLLSLKDLNLSDYLADMALAGITSFKIEGRLKDDNYLKNITAYYRRRLDAFLENNYDYRKASSGKVWFDFVPDPAKTFSRGTSNYFLQGRSADIVSSDTPKSAGEYIGKLLIGAMGKS